MLVPISSSKSQGLLTGLPEPPFIQAHYSIRIELASLFRFYVNKCETLTSQPGLAANILIRKLSMLRFFSGRISHPLYGLNPVILPLNKAIGYPVIEVV